MTDSRPVLEQYNELLGILGRFTQHKMNMDEAIQVSCIIDKLPPSWKDFKHTLKHKKEELTLVELGSHLRIEESLRVDDSDKPKGNNVAGPSVVNMVEQNNSSRYNDSKGKGKHHDNTKADPNKKAKPTCWKCGQTGHIKRDCKGVNIGNKANGSGTKGSVNGSFNSLKGQNMFNKSLQVYYVTYISEAYFVQDDDVAWWVDSGATVYVSKDRCWFKTYESLNDGSILHMGNVTPRLSQGFWGEAMLTTCYLLNMVPNKGNKITPYELWTKRKPNLNYIRVWGCRPVVRTSDLKLKTLGERGIECIFVGYAEHSKSFRDAIFDENRFSSVPRPSLRIPNRTEDNGGSVVPKEVTEEVEDNLKTFDEAMKSQDVAFWKEAINDEMNSITGNNTWVLADLPPGINTIRLLTVMASIHNLIIHQMDVKIAFLNGELDEEVYMNQPYKFDEISKGVIICLYIDDMLIFGTDQVHVDMTKEFLSSRCFVKDMGEADVILCIRIKHESNGITIYQSHYIEKVLKKFNYFDCSPMSTPMDTSEKLMPNNSQAVSQLEYSRVIGCLIVRIFVFLT
ncbi:zinc finger, CCHC-type containing protein [Tanacetum coccineum]